MEQVKPVVHAGTVRFAEKCCVTRIMRLLEGSVGCLRRSEVMVAGGPRLVRVLVHV